MGVQGTVGRESDRPIPLERITFPPMDPGQKFDPFEAACVMPYNVRDESDKGRYLEAITVFQASPDGERVFVRFHRTGNTAWIESDRLVDR